MGRAAYGETAADALTGEKRPYAFERGCFIKVVD